MVEAASSHAGEPARGLRSAWIKLALLTLVLAVDVATWPDLWADMGTARFLRVPAVFAALGLAMLCAAWVQDRWLRWLYAAALGIGALPVLGYRFSVGEITTFFAFATTVDARSAWVDALPMYGPWMALAALVSLGTLVAVAIRPTALPGVRRMPWLRWLVAAVPLLAMAALAFTLIERQRLVRGIPSAWQGIGFAMLYSIDMSEGVAGPRKAVALAREPRAADGDIVLVIDESVSANYLDLNAPGGARSGLADVPPEWRVHDFGIASSITNCSMQTNVSLRFGAQKHNFKERIARDPSIWAYARNAGYRTVYLYGQRGGYNENFMTDAERAEIDDARYFDTIEMAARDHHLAGVLAGLLTNDTPEFILMSKAGVHAPLVGVYPYGEGRFQPEPNLVALQRDSEYWLRYRNSYRNAIEWSVAGFFDRLFEEAGNASRAATIIYTSDHGQTLYEAEAAGKATHCRKNAAMEEGVVPLVVIERADRGASDWGSALDARRDASSQFRIFPSLLMAMGYDREAAEQAYGPSLIDRSADPMQFAIGMHIRLNREPVWLAVDPDEVFRPQRERGSP